jgi:hypothetical protein
VLDQDRVDGDPVLRVDALPKRCLGLLGRAGTDHAEPVGDPVDVRVDRDRRDPVAEHEHAVGGLRADARERGELLEVPGNDPTEPLEDLAGHGPDHARFHAIEPRYADQGFDLARCGRRQALRVREPGEQARARDVGIGVAGALRKDRSDQHLERILGVVPQVRSTPVARAVELAQPVQQELPVERPRPGAPRHGADLPLGRFAVPTAAGVVTPGSERSGSSSSPSPRRSSPIR